MTDRLAALIGATLGLALAAIAAFAVFQLGNALAEAGWMVP